MFSSNRIRVGAASLALLLAFAACGDDDKTDTASSGSGSSSESSSSDVEKIAAYCEPFLEFQGKLFDGPEEPEAGFAFAKKNLLPLVDEIEAASTPENADVVDPFVARFQKVTSLEEYNKVGSEFESGGEVIKVLAAIQLDAADNCGYERLDVTAVDYGFQGMPADLEPGKYAIVFTNGTKKGEFHELAMFTPKDATQSLDELLALPEGEGEDATEEVGGTFAPPGQKGVAFVEITDGPVYYACFVPEGSGEGKEDGAPHFTLGMKGEIAIG